MSDVLDHLILSSCGLCRDASVEIMRLRAINAELLEDYRGKIKAYGEASDEVEHLLDINEKLLAALETIWHAPEGPNLAGSIQAMRDKARAAIAKAKRER